MRRLLGMLQLLLGGSIILYRLPRVTGAVVGVLSADYFSFLGVLLLVTGILTLRSKTLEERVEKPVPGKGIGGSYVSLKEVISRGHEVSNKVHLDVADNRIYRDGVVIQGMKLEGEHVEFVGYHFTNHRAGDMIEHDRKLEVLNAHDPYIYFLEPKHYGDASVNEIRQLTGANSAEEVVIAKVRYPVDKVYLKVEKNRPTHFAVDGDITSRDIVRHKGHYMQRKDIGEL